MLKVTGVIVSNELILVRLRIINLNQHDDELAWLKFLLLRKLNLLALLLADHGKDVFLAVD